MKKNLLILLASLAALALLGGGGWFLQRVFDRVESDMHVGFSEQAVRARFGEPARASSRQASALFEVGVTEGLRSRLRSMRNADDDLSLTIVKELYYTRWTGCYYFWLTQQADGSWRVFSDIWVPEGVVF